MGAPAACLCLACTESSPAADPPPRPPPREGATPAPPAHGGTAMLVPCPSAACLRGIRRHIAIPHLTLPDLRG